MVIATILVMEQTCSMNTKPARHLPDKIREERKPERIGYRLRLVREALGLKPSEIADSLGIERTYWSRFEGGKRAISDDVAALLVVRYGVTLDFLILGDWSKLPLDLAEKMRAIVAKEENI